MKKLFAILLALVLGLGAAVAEGPTEATDATEAGAITFTKSYAVNGDGTFPGETLAFTVDADKSNPDGGKALVTVGTGNTFAVTGIDTAIPVNYPAYEKAGVYRYTIKEVEGNTQGVTYDTGTEIAIAILVSYDADGKLQVEATGVEKASKDADKVDTIENTYALGGDNEKGSESLKVTKEIKGNLADPEKVFTIHVTLKAEKDVLSAIEVGADSKEDARVIAPTDWKDGEASIDVHLKAGATVTFDRIPEGVTYAVVEDAAHLCAGEAPTTDELNGDEGYLAAYENENGAIAKGKKPEAKVTNTKETEVNTGISLDSLPYILILAVVVIGGIAWLLRRRRHDED